MAFEALAGQLDGSAYVSPACHVRKVEGYVEVQLRSLTHLRCDRISYTNSKTRTKGYDCDDSNIAIANYNRQHLHKEACNCLCEAGKHEVWRL
jgi:hypothetical protein